MLLNYRSYMCYIYVYNCVVLAVLQSIWSLQIQCFHLSGGLLGSTGWPLVVIVWSLMRHSYTGEFDSLFFLLLFKLFFLVLSFCSPMGLFGRLSVIFLAFDVVFVVICVAVACLIGIAVCCCLPCIIAILYVVTDQVIATNFECFNFGYVL